MLEHGGGAIVDSSSGAGVKAHSDGQANSLRGDGTLSATPPGGEPSDVYLFNPFRPVPTVGGQVILPGATSMGPRDQREVEVRDDVLVLVLA